MDRIKRTDKKMPFEEVYGEYYDRIYRAVYMRLLNRENTEDVVQDTFVKAMNAYDRFDPDKASLYTWLYTIATNTLYDRFRKDEGSKIVAFEDYVEAGMEPGADDPELIKLTDGYAREAYVILKQLSETERELIAMRFGLELSYSEMAVKLSSTEKAVGMRMSRLLDKCRGIAEKEQVSQDSL